MNQLRLRNIPVLEDGEIAGIITDKDLSDPALTGNESGGKKGFIANVLGRKGLPGGTRVTSRRVRDMANTPSDMEYQAPSQLTADVGSFALPHPFKRKDNCELSRRYN